MSLKENQIVCLEHKGNNLYGEVIQLIDDRQLCWFRPLCLIISADSVLITQLERTGSSSDSSKPQKYLLSEPKNTAAIDISTEGLKIINLQSGSDLLWPDSLFRPALDTEIINFLPYLPENLHQPKVETSGKKYLNKFVHLFWQAHQDKF